MTDNPILGVLLLTLGGVGGGSFYVPFGKVRQWSWETHWMIMGVPAWVVMPWLVAWLTVPHLPEVLSNSPVQILGRAYLFGAMWGIGAATFGLTMRYLGISLGMAIVVGLCAAFGTLIPPLVDGKFAGLLVSLSGLTVLLGVVVCLLGIAVCGRAGFRKERELTDQQKRATIKEFALVKGFVVATVSGVMSACMVFGINAGEPIGRVAVELGVSSVYQNAPTLILVLAGGFTVNSLCCLTLNLKNRSIHEYVSRSGSVLLANYLLVALAGIVWYSQIFLYGMGTTKMGEYAFSSWSLITAVGITVSTLWGLALKEWKGVSTRTLLVLWSGILILILSALIMGAGSYLKTMES
jgi:L-rhamnose-H+ transport protein